MVLIAVLLIIFVDNMWSNDLYIKSLFAIKAIQTHSTKALNYFFIAIAYTGTLPVFLVVMTLIYNYDDRSNWFFINLSAFVSYSATSILKLGYKAPRPYYIDEGINALQCESGYAKPSGHALESSQFLLNLWFMYMYHYSKAKLARILTLFFAVLFIALIMFDRLYLGVHSLDQVIMGAYLGTLISISFNMLFYDVIKRAYKMIANREEGYRKYAIPGIIVMLGVHAFNIVIFILNKNNNMGKAYEDTWTQNMVTKCPNSISTDLYRVPFIHLSNTLVFITMFIAMLYSSRKFPESIEAWHYESGKGKRIARLLLMLVVMFICYSPAIFYHPQNVILKAGLCCVVPSLLMGIWFMVVDRLALKIKLSTQSNKSEGMNNIKDEDKMGNAIEMAPQAINGEPLDKNSID